jgi:hypothetical protein
MRSLLQSHNAAMSQLIGSLFMHTLLRPRRIRRSHLPCVYIDKLSRCTSYSSTMLELRVVPQSRNDILARGHPQRPGMIE